MRRLAVYAAMAFASNVQTYKQIASLTFRVTKAGLSRQSEAAAACELCDAIIGLVLKFDDASPEDVSCDDLCPFGMRRCVTTCEAIVEAIATSSHYPCVAAQLCPDPEANEDEGPFTCAWDRKTRSCAPAGLCEREGRFPLLPGVAGRCRPNDGVRMWTKYQGSLAKHAGALFGALQRRPRCNCRRATASTRLVMPLPRRAS